MEGGWKAMKARMVLDERGHGKMWLMFMLLNNIDLCIQEQNYNGNIYGGGGKSCCPNEYEVEVVVNTCAQLKWSSYKHFRFPISKWLNQTWVSLSPTEPPQGGSTKHHWQNSRNKCHVMLKGSCLRGVIKLFVFLHKAMAMWEYKYGHEKPRWKALRMSRL